MHYYHLTDIIAEIHLARARHECNNVNGEEFNPEYIALATKQFIKPKWKTAQS